MSDILTDADLAEIEKRAEAATSGIWVPWISPDGTVSMVNHAALLDSVDDGPLMIASCDVTGNLDNDAAFIAHARTDIPRLLKEIARLRGENQTLYEAMMDKDRACELLQEIDSHWRRNDPNGAMTHHRDQVTRTLEGGA